MSKRQRRARSPIWSSVEMLETRTLMSTSYAVMVMQAPQSPAMPVQVDQSALPGPLFPASLMTSALDLQMRTVAGGVILTVAASSRVLSPLAPGGTVDIFAESQFLGTVELGKSFRSTVVLPPGSHTFFATYNGDANFLPSQTSIERVLEAPTATPPANPADAPLIATNDSGKRVRPMRMLSFVNYFDAHDPTVTATPPGPPPPQGSTNPPGGSGGVTLSSGPPALGTPLPNPRFSKISFSVKLPRLTGVK